MFQVPIKIDQQDQATMTGPVKKDQKQQVMTWLQTNAQVDTTPMNHTPMPIHHTMLMPTNHDSPHHPMHHMTDANAPYNDANALYKRC